MNRACLNVILLSVVTLPSTISKPSCCMAMARYVYHHMAIHPVCCFTDFQPFQRLKCKTFQIGNCNKMINILFFARYVFLSHFIVSKTGNCYPPTHTHSLSLSPSLSSSFCMPVYLLNVSVCVWEWTRAHSLSKYFRSVAAFLHTNCQVPLPPWHCKPIKTTKLPDVFSLLLSTFSSSAKRLHCRAL